MLIAMCQALFKCFSNISSLTPHNNPMRYRNKPYFTHEKIELRRGPASHMKSQNHSLDPCGLAPGTHTCSVGHPCRADVLHSEGNVLNVVCIIGWDTTQPWEGVTFTYNSMSRSTVGNGSCLEVSMSVLLHAGWTSMCSVYKIHCKM